MQNITLPIFYIFTLHRYIRAEHIPTGLGSNTFHQQFSGWLWVALQVCFDTAGWVKGRSSSPHKNPMPPISKGSLLPKKVDKENR